MGEDGGEDQPQRGERRLLPLLLRRLRCRRLSLVHVIDVGQRQPITNALARSEGDY